MNTRQLTKIALMACILEVVFISFSQILYLEAITLTVCLFASVSTRKEAVLSSLIFGLANLLIQGMSPWTMAYAVIFPCYSLLIYQTRGFLLKHPSLLAMTVGLLSFLTGQLLDLPFILFSPKVTMIYIVMGLKTSLIQGAISAVSAIFLFDPLYQALVKIERKYS